ncbi:hypothetical protein EYR38_008230 [Pleurotus pulmonarius]|nr:hypothetical protein EYR38_008230 [Pleurotus pulmonarius]
MEHIHYAIAIGIVSLLAYLKRRSAKRPPYPPGPPADPLIGHLRVMPTEKHESVFHEWSKLYGDVMHLKILGRNMIVLNSVQAATDLLEKRSALYSDRPNMNVYVGIGWDSILVFLPYGQRFRKHRQLLHSHFGQHAGPKFQPIQLQNALILAQGLMENTKDYQHLLGRYTTAIVMRIAYGHQIISDDDEFVRIAHDKWEHIDIDMSPGVFSNALPIMVSWLHDRPYEYVKQRMAEGTAEHSFLSEQLDTVSGKTLTDDEIRDLKGSAGAIFAAGGETTWSSLETFFLAMLHYPEVQKKGQREIDSVIGPDRLPTFEDFNSLPYVARVTQEILRGMALDESVYAEPTQFNPDRYLPKSQGGSEEPYFDAVFGFGRRICPGRHLAAASIWIAVATVFATVNINKVKDEDGNEIIPELDFETGITSRPKHFPCTTTPRSDKVVRLVSTEFDALSF